MLVLCLLLLHLALVPRLLVCLMLLLHMRMPHPCIVHTIQVVLDGTRQVKGGVVTPSLHPEVPNTQFASPGRYVDLAFAFALGAGLAPDATCRFNREGGSGSRRDFIVGCPNALAASDACYVTDRWFTPHLSVSARFRIDAWMADFACPIVCLPVWPACWLDTPGGSSSSSTRVVQDVWDVYRNDLETVPEEVVACS